MTARGKFFTAGLAVLTLSAVVTACTTSSPRPESGGASSSSASEGWHPPLPLLHAEADSTSGGRIVDAEGREVVLRGVNVNALVEYWRYGKFRTTFPLTEADARRMAAIGWNVVRLGVSWSRIEPRPGDYDDAYLERVRGAVRLLARHGLYTIVDLHQDAWGPTLAARADEHCSGNAEPAFGWDGAPGWATLDGGAPRCAVAGIRELSPAVRAAFDAFWRNASGPGGVGIRTRYVRMLGHVAAMLASESAVAGYDLMNEPNALNPQQVESMAGFYREAVAAIRAAEPPGSRHVVFFEPAIPWSDVGSGTPPVFTDDDDLVFAPHLYRGGLKPGPAERAEFERARRDAARFGGVPVLIGEWGADPRRAADPHDDYFRRHQDLQDEFRFSATLWSWRESCGDPHKAAEARSGKVPRVWSVFDVDCRTNDVLGPRRALVDQLSRGYVRAAPGRLGAMRFASSSGTLSARGTEARAGAELVAWYPARPDHRKPRVASSGLDDLGVRPGPEGGWFLVGTARGGAWQISAPE